MRESFHVAYQSGRAMGQNAAAAIACCSTTSRALARAATSDAE